MVTKIAVFTVQHGQARLGYCFHQLMPLFKKWTAKIHVTAEIPAIKITAHPIISAVNDRELLRIIIGHNPFACAGIVDKKKCSGVAKGIKKPLPFTGMEVGYGHAEAAVGEAFLLADFKFFSADTANGHSYDNNSRSYG